MNPNIAGRLQQLAARHAGRLAFVSYAGGRRTTVTFGELAARMAGFSRELRRRGIGAGDRVLLFVPMSVELYVALLGVHHAGAVAVFVDAWADRRRLEAAVRAAMPRAFVGTPRAHLLRVMSAAVRGIPVSMVVRRGVGGDGGAPGEPAAEVAPGTPALVTFTTGSTGRPKAAARTHEFLWAQHVVLAQHLGHREGGIDMPTLPVFVLDNLAASVTSVLPRFDPRRPAEFDAARVLEQMRAERVATASGSPAFFERLCAHVERTGATLPLAAFHTGGAPVPPALATRFARACPASQVLYGSTEAEPISAITAAELAVRTRAAGARGLCAGRPIAEIEVKIVRATDGPIELGAGGWGEWRTAPGEVGEIVVSGAHVLRGYLDDADADRENKIRDGDRTWHRTGDGGSLDEHGALWLAGRVKQRVRRGGATWWGLPVELRAMELPGIAHAAYVGVRDAALGACAVLCVETPGGGLDDSTRRELIAAAAPAPVDRVVAMRHIPRDPRHASKTDAERLLRIVG